MQFEQQNERDQKKSSTNLITQSDIDIIFQKMIEVYVHRFTSGYGVVDSGIWLSTLRHLTPQEIKLGLEKMAAPGTKYSDFPPSPLAFRKLCKPSENSQTPYYQAYKDYQRALPKPRNLELAKKSINALRSMLGLKKSEAL